jgi:hypothetical protein
MNGVRVQLKPNRRHGPLDRRGTPRGGRRSTDFIRAVHQTLAVDHPIDAGDIAQPEQQLRQALARVRAVAGRRTFPLRLVAVEDIGEHHQFDRFRILAAASRPDGTEVQVEIEVTRDELSNALYVALLLRNELQDVLSGRNEA